DALVQARERLLYEALSRAIIGIEEPRYYKGEIIGYEHKPSDLLLRYLLAHPQEAFSQNSQTISKTYEASLDDLRAKLKRLLGRHLEGEG
ncbi:MAG: hypothetical protein ACON49_07525, partial [Candidatus Puniceispirillaceae bacterium]